MGMNPQNLDLTPEPQQPPVSPNIGVDETEAKDIVNQCNKFKQSVQAHAREKKQTMRTCYAYSKQKFVGGDLMPTPSTHGSDKDANKARPKVFIPVMRQQMKQLFSYLKLTIFPNDEDYFRVKGKNAAAAQLENDLTEGLKYKFKEALLTEKMGQALYSLCWAGNAAVCPNVKRNIRWEWQVDTMLGEYRPVQIEDPPTPDLDIFNPLSFYIDPTATDPDTAKWGHFGTKKLQEVRDNPVFFNIDQLNAIASEQADKLSKKNEQELDSFNGLQSTFQDIEKHLDYDIYYFPYLKTNNREYRNMIVGVAGEQVLVRFHPNLLPKGMNPGVFFNWMQDADSPYGTGPAEDIMELQRLINILYNHIVETMARIGNRFAVSPEADLSNLFGVAGGVIVTQNPGQDVVPLSGNYNEIDKVADIAGVFKAEAQQTAGAQTPFQGASEIDYQKTATELQILQENSISIIREIIEHVSVTGVQRILERMMYLCADLYSEPFQIRIDDPMTGTRFITVDFSVLKSGQFVIELVNVNPSQSKQAQVNGLMQLMQLVMTNPQALFLVEPLIQKVWQLQGVKDIQNLIDEMKNRLGGMLGPQQPPLPPAEAGMGDDPEQGMEGIPQAPPGA